jgi:hypothetical protein
MTPIDSSIDAARIEQIHFDNFQLGPVIESERLQKFGSFGPSSGRTDPVALEQEPFNNM